MNAEIIAIGSELLTPYRQDTNSLFLTEKLNSLGVLVDYKTVVGDNRAHLTSVAKLALSRTDISIFIGGLGPTEDDLTRECVAAALGLELRRDHDILAKLYARFASRRVQMAPNNERQADVIAGAAVLPNQKGTAPGQWLEGEYGGKKKIIILLPGPPFELKAMWDSQCMDRLRAVVPKQFITTRELKLAILAESHVDARAAPIYKTYPDVQTTILANTGEIQIHLRGRAESFEAAQRRVDELAGKLEEEFGEAVFSTSGESLEQIVAYFLQLRNATIAVAESCTGGLLAEHLTSISGSSRYFLGGAIVYSNELKTELAGVPPLMIAEKGAVSAEVAIALAEGIRRRCRATLGVGVTGIAGPTGGTEGKPVGLVYHAVSNGVKTDVIERTYPGDRERIRMFATRQALDMIRRKLMD